MELNGTCSAPVLVLGATGGQGGAVAAALMRARRAVLALVRDPQSASARKLGTAGAQLVAGDFTDRDALAAAMRGAAGAFALTTPFESGPPAELAQGDAIIAAAATAGLPHLVFSSVAGATAHTGIPHFESKARVEQALAASGLAHTVVAPTYFYDKCPRRLPGRAGRRAGAPASCRPSPPAARPYRPGLIRRHGARRPSCLQRQPVRAGERRTHAGANEPGIVRNAWPTSQVPRDTDVRRPASQL
jgi:uncharacterized protein YbjT (DUF2867 family)